MFACCLLLVGCAEMPRPSKQAGTLASDSDGASKPATSTPRISELSDTAWRLVQIQSMDDRVYTPEPNRPYVISFLSEGKAMVEADCNRGRGAWTSEGRGRLRVGPMAVTKVACPPGSLGSRFVTDLSFVRSYVLEEDRLFLATMADGAILEFAPMK